MFDAAIALFAYRRPAHAAKTLNALLKSKGSTKLPLYVFADGPRIQDDFDEITRVRDLLSGFDWPGGVSRSFANTNRGLANSIVLGVSEVLKRHEAVIVLEDDIVLAESAIEYFVQALERFYYTPSVASVSGFSHPERRLRFPSYYPYDSYFLRRNSSWGWATWHDRWAQVSWDIDKWLKLRNNSYVVSCLEAVSPDLPKMLDRQAAGGIDSWAVRFTLHHFLKGCVSLTPVHSYVENIGMDGSGTHTGVTDAYRNDLARAATEHRFPPFVSVDPAIAAAFARLYRPPSVPRRALRKVRKVIGR